MALTNQTPTDTKIPNVRLFFALSTILAILFIDQITKIYVKTHFFLGESVEIYSWFKILFIENKGMAWGASIPGSTGKLFLTSFRIIAVIALGVWAFKKIRSHKPFKQILAPCLIFSGALGNLIDSLFYGMIFTNSLGQIAQADPGNGYDGFMFGKVVDMIQFPLFNGTFPKWFPFLGGDSFLFFSPIFNIADTSVSIGVAIFCFFNKKF